MVKGLHLAEDHWVAFVELELSALVALPSMEELAKAMKLRVQGMTKVEELHL